MAELSISKAAEYAGISRQKLYDNYINKGKITVQRDHRNKPYIDTSEILRAFGELKNSDSTNDSISDTRGQSENTGDSALLSAVMLELEKLKAENAGLQALAEERKSRIEEQKEWISSLEARYDRLLEDKRPVSEKEEVSPGFWRRVKAVFAP